MTPDCSLHNLLIGFDQKSPPDREEDVRIVTAEKSSLDQAGVRFIADRLARPNAGSAILGLPGGRSVSGILDGLVKAPIDWPRVHIFLADERKVPVTDPESNYREILEHLAEPLSSTGRMPAANVHPCVAGAPEYSAEFGATGNHFDVLVLGVGEDGHIASLFPGRIGATEDPGFFIDVENSPKPPPRRVSASQRLIQGSSSIVLLFIGAGKKEALRLFRDPSVPASDCPAKLTTVCTDLLVLTDQEIS